ncbi:MAG: hypothetical protein ACM31L_13290, partial [Actinomycetota bacterium]
MRNNNVSLLLNLCASVPLWSIHFVRDKAESAATHLQSAAASLAHHLDVWREALAADRLRPRLSAPIPIWISDYVLMGYGTGAIMAVPAHDERDFQFATKFEIPIIEVIAPKSGAQGTLDEAYTGDGVMVNSGR